MGKKKDQKIIDKIIEEYTDEEVLEVFAQFLDRVTITTQFIQNEDNLFTDHLILLLCGDKIIASDPIEFEWPLQLLPMPTTFEGRIQ